MAAHVDTNKQTLQEKIAWEDDETHEEFERRVVTTLSALTEVS